AHHLADERDHVGRFEALLVDRDGHAVHLHLHRAARRSEQVRCPLFRHQAQQPFHRAHPISSISKAGRALAPDPRSAQSPRSNSLMLVFSRVAAVTRLTITAQYRLWLPSAAGSEPLTT